jgi:Ferritin-like domain
VSDGGGRLAPGQVSGLSRRALLTGAAAALPVVLTACKGVQALGSPPPPAPDVRTLEAAITAERAMVARYAEALRQVRSGAHAAVPGVLQAIQAEHAQHLTQLESRLTRPGGASPSPSAPASPAAGAAPSLSSVLSGLEAAEATASHRYLAQLGGLPPSLAQLFASIAASEATHVPYLHAARRGR